MLQERDRSTLLKRINPASKLWMALGLILSNIIIKNLWFSLAIIVISAILIIREKQFTLFKVIIVTMIVLGGSMYALHGAIAPIIDKANDPVLFTVFGIRYYAKGFAYATRFVMRTIPMMCSLFLLFMTMDMADLGAVMCNAGIPYKFTFTFIDSFQVITLLSKEMEQIKDAQRARGLNMEGNLIQRFKAFLPIIIPVVANSIVKVQDQAIAMDTKGFNSKCKKTVYREIVVTPLDKAVTVVGILLAVIGAAYGICTRVGVITPFLTNII